MLCATWYEGTAQVLSLTELKSHNIMIMVHFVHLLCGAQVMIVIMIDFVHWVQLVMVMMMVDLTLGACVNSTFLCMDEISSLRLNCCESV